MAISAIAGMGGIGKTELAWQYAHKHWELETYPDAVCWLRAREDLGQQIVSFGREKLGLEISQEWEFPEQVSFCWERLQQSAALVVFDDVQAFSDIKPFLAPVQSRLKVLLTTRSSFGASVQNFEIKVLSVDKALELLRAIVKDQRVDQDLATAKQVCEWLGCLPLGLELVGRYLAKKKDVSIAELWKRLQSKKLFAKVLLAAESGMTALLGVTAAFELSWQDLDQNSQQLAALLSLFALAEIPWSLVEACLSEEDQEDLEDLRDEKLLGASLLTRTDDGMYELHQLLREFFAVKREQMADVDEMKRSFCKVMVREGQKVPQQPTLSVLQAVLPAIPHLKEAATTLNPWLSDDDLITPVTRIAWFNMGQSAFAEAEQWYEQCRAIAEPRLGDDHPDVATSLNNLALLYDSQGRYSDAEPLLLKALDICQRQLGDDHPDVATSLNNLAGLYDSQGRYSDAEPLLLKALDICQRQLGDDHPDVATSLNNLAGLYDSQGRYSDAEPLFLQALAILLEKLEADHPKTQTVWQNFLLFLQKVMQEARLDDLSNDPWVRSLLQQLQDASD